MSSDEPRQPNPLLVRLGALLEATLNRVLALDTETRARLASLQDRRIGVELRGTSLALGIAVRDGRLCIGPHEAKSGDLNLRASPASFLAMALRRGEDSALPPGKVEVSGDAELARRVEKLLRDFRPDIEEVFAQTFGDVLGVALARALRAAFAHTRETAQALVQDTAEFLREESRDLIAPAQMETFLDEVDDLRERAERLQARVLRLTPDAGKDAA
jgi:ubiquinone biosynthesis protein UbiJ